LQAITGFRADYKPPIPKSSDAAGPLGNLDVTSPIELIEVCCPFVLAPAADDAEDHDFSGA